MNEEVLRRLKFLKEKMKNVQREVIEMESLVVSLDEEFYKNQKAIERLEKELKTLKECSIICVKDMSKTQKGRFLINTEILKEHDFAIWDAETQLYEVNETLSNSRIPLVTQELPTFDFNMCLQKFLIETKEKALKYLQKRNEKLVADLESLTQDYKGE